MGMVQWLLLVLLLILAVSNVTFQFTFFQSGASYDLCPSWKSFSGKLPIRVNSIKGTKSEMYHKSSFTYRNFSLRFYWFVPAEKPEDEFPPLLMYAAYLSFIILLLDGFKEGLVLLLCLDSSMKLVHANSMKRIN